MENVNPATMRDVFIILAAIVTIICMVIRTRNSGQRNPPAGETLSAITANLKAIDRDLGNTKRRLEKHEELMIKQLGDVWKQYDLLLAAVSGNGAKLELFIEEIRNWRNTHA